MKKLNQKTLLEEKVKVEFADNVWGYKVFQNGRERAIFMLTTQRFKNGSFKAYPATNIVYTLEDGSKIQKVETLHRIVYVAFIGDIPEGMVVDHIDNDPQNNDLKNLQVLTRSENTSKNSVGHNQYTPLEERVHQPK